jgi:hypothetical protein
MAITPRKIIGTAVGIGRTAVSTGVRFVGGLRGGKDTGPPETPGTPAYEAEPGATASPEARVTGSRTGRTTPGPTRTARAKASGAKRRTSGDAPKRRTSGSPDSVGAPKPGEPGGHKSASAAKPKRSARPPAGATEPPAAKPPPDDKA